MYQEAAFKDYYRQIRSDIIELIPTQPGNRILDVGCGEGVTGYELKRLGKAEYVAGIEVLEPIAVKAAKRLDEVIHVGIEHWGKPKRFKQYFDYILLADVLEHLTDPWTTLRELGFYLKPEGYIIASIPNIRNYKILRDLIFFDRWEYVDSGILDRTHMRFFTKTTIRAMFDECGYSVSSIQTSMKSLRRRERLANRLTLGLFEEFITVQYLVEACREKKRD